VPVAWGARAARFIFSCLAMIGKDMPNRSQPPSLNLFCAGGGGSGVSQGCISGPALAGLHCTGFRSTFASFWPALSPSLVAKRAAFHVH
jgi:glycine/D-amino acid oxidase-like deaminating enzyme